jgi:DNA-binding response OmpR family regulator
MPARIVLISTDLMVTSRIQGAAARCGATVRVVGSATAAIERHHEEPATLVVVDLATPSLQLVDLVDTFKQQVPSPVPVIAFGPHVHEDKLAAARAAGCDLVMSRGKFFSEVDSIVAGAAD